MQQWLSRTELLIGDGALNSLNESHVLVIGLGGVGSFATEFLVRSGIGTLTIIDGDTVDITNINRQLQALHSTVGMSKAQILAGRLRDINPSISLTTYTSFMEPVDMDALLSTHHFDFVMDCIDSLSPKLRLITWARRHKLPFISAMGAGGKLDPTKIKIADISKTKECKFAQTIKKRLKKEGVRDGVLTVYSEEIQPKSALQMTDGKNYKRSYYGTISYMPALFGLMMASEVIRRIGKLKKT